MVDRIASLDHALAKLIGTRPVAGRAAAASSEILRLRHTWQKAKSVSYRSIS